MAKSAIEMIGVNKWFGDFHVHKDINLTVASGQHVVICGPLDRGKPTVVRCINRFEVHQQGTIRVDGMDLTVNVRSVAAITSEVGVVFQQFNLFPHLSVLENRMPGPIYIEFVRAGVQSIVRGQVEAAHSIRLNCMQTMHYAILPQAVRHIFPPLTNQFIYIVKMSSFASAIGMQE